MMKSEEIPSELKELDRWVSWDADNKVPLTPSTLAYAKVNDPLTWGSFEAASATGRVGFVFTDGDPYVGIDLDKCHNPVTGEIEDWALEVIDSFDSYSEISPSGTGIHIFVRGKLPFPKGRKNGRCEIYEHSRYFTVTGTRLASSPKEIHNRQIKIDKFCDSHLSGEQERKPSNNNSPHANERRVTEPRKWRFEWRIEEILIKQRRSR
jgi:putative DNA primase/helicase